MSVFVPLPILSLKGERLVQKIYVMDVISLGLSTVLDGKFFRFEASEVRSKKQIGAQNYCENYCRVDAYLVNCLELVVVFCHAL